MIKMKGKRDNTRKPKKDVYQIITDRVLELLNKGCVPWKQPWNDDELPQNLTTRRKYRGINTWLLNASQIVNGYKSQYWLTFKQVKELGGHVKAGAKSEIVVFWLWFESDDENGEEVGRSFAVPKYYRVFNADQVEGIEIPEDAKTEKLEFSPIQTCEEVINSMPNCPEIDHEGMGMAYYRPSTDKIHMPQKSKFICKEKYYSVLFHELIHSTAHPNRCNRNFEVMKKSKLESREYAKEELVAEMGSCFLCGHTRIENDTIENSAAYIENWKKAISNDNRLVMMAASKAQRAADFILNVKHEN